MTIRRRQPMDKPGGRVRPAIEPCLGVEDALRNGREAVSRAFESSVGEVKGEISRARAVFADAENLITRDSRKVHEVFAASLATSEALYDKTMEAAERGEASANSAMKKMLDKLNKIAGAIAHAQAPPGGSSQS